MINEVFGVKPEQDNAAGGRMKSQMIAADLRKDC